MSSGTKETVYLFGPQVLSFNKEVSTLLHSTLTQKPHQEWVRKALSQLPGYWETILSDVPSLTHSPGRMLLEDLMKWIDTGSFSSQLTQLPSIILTPLVVALQLSQYITLLEVSFPEQTDRHQANLVHLGSQHSVAFCTGILAAIAISASEDDTQLQQYGSAAIRIAMLIGAVVDDKDGWGQKDKQSTSISLGWSSSDGDNDIMTVLRDFPNAYISVSYDEKRATVTTPAIDLESLTAKFKGLGITVTDVSLRGRFHFAGNEEMIASLNEICNSNPGFRFPSSSALRIPLISESSENFRSNSLHLWALRSILVDKCDWYKTLSSIQQSTLANTQTTVYNFGLEQCIPPTIMRKTRARLVNTIDVLWREIPSLSSTQLTPVREDAIAVVGMSCKVAGADDIDEFWSLLREGKSQHVEVPDDRIYFGTQWREPDQSRKWYANFIRDPDAFDHRFFKKSPREMMSTDPQQRWMMQIAYQAVEQSGYFHSASPEKHIGCYVGVGCIDYENNIACHPANAFSATGNLKSFVAGKISHWFGWTGPSMTIDTACSASAVAVHQACKAILSGDCNAAVAGGVTIMTSPLWFQNLAGGGFLSPTGNCKPFDADADGYCRGEGVGAVFLKKLSTAIADGDQILGVLPATAVYQNMNCTPITVPNAESLSDLFRYVTNSAGLDPKQISVVEAHGTGTPVGDPAEYESVRRIFGGPRPDIVFLGSVKGLIGHTETASGIMSLIKVLLMINEGGIPPQASFNSLSPSIKASLEDNIEVSKSLKIWESKFRAALINNYGASGSNASMVVTQAPHILKRVTKGTSDEAGKFPFWLCGYDDQSLRDYVSRLLMYLRDRKASSKFVSLADLSFNVSRQSNRTLKQALIFSSDSASDLEGKLADFQTGDPRQASISCQPSRPVIFCFGGQISTFVGLDRELYNNVAVLRKYLHQCDAVIQSNGLPTIHPLIFSRDPVPDPVVLQVMLFACQYSCAKAWIECGVTPAAVVGHSFGELVALCISGVLSLGEALQMIIGRATAIRENWGDEKGAMLAVEGVEEIVHELLQQANLHSGGKATIACYNGPRSFTLAGTSNSIDAVADMIATTNSFSSIRSKRLNVTNAFHSTLVDALKPRLEEIGRNLTFNDPNIPIELATESETSSGNLSSSYVAQHMRNPVYFNHAVQRLSKKYPSAIWLECGSNSTITNIACRALGNPVDSHFQPVNITSSQSINLLTDATLSLWKQGLNFRFWPHHASQTTEYQTLLLPPYQFAKNRHWVELKRPELKQAIVYSPDSSDNQAIVGLWSFIEYRDSAKTKARFRINTTAEEFKEYIRGHTIAQAAPLCPSTLQLSIVIDALMHLNPSYAAENYYPQLNGLDNHQPMCIDSTKAVWLDFVTNSAASRQWDFRMVSTSLDESPSETLHVSGTISFRSVDDVQLQRDFTRYEHLSDYQRCRNILENPYASDIIQGRNIYRTFSEIVEYGEPYQGLTKIVGSELKSAGRVVKAHKAECWLDTHLADSFCQVAGIFVNCMTDTPRTEIAISTKIEQWIRSPHLRPGDPRPEIWDVLALHRRPSEKEWMSDVFIFDPRDGSLVEVILGIGYQRVSRASLGKLLSRLTNNGESPIQPAAPTSESFLKLTSESIPGLSVQNSEATQADKHEPAPSESPNIYPRMLELVCGISGLEAHEIQLDTKLPDIGIDSLVGMELAREIEVIFKISLDPSELMEVDDMTSLTKCVEKALGIESAAVDMKPTENPRKHSVINGYITPVEGSGTPEWHNEENCIMTPPKDEMKLEPEVILESFAESKAQTDNFIAEHKLGGYADHVLPKQTELCVAHIAEAFEELGCSLLVSAGTPLARVPHVTKQKIPVFVDYIYEKILCKEAKIIEFRDSRMVRTATPLPARSAKDLLSELIKDFPDHENDHRLISFAGCRLAECLSGKTDGVRVIFGSAEGRDLVSGLYGRSPINMAFLKQMEDFTQRIISRIPKGQGPLKILEMGAGTGGTTAGMAKLLARLNVPVEYTFTDLSPSLVAAAGRRFKNYPFLKFQTHDIEKPPPMELVQSQHIVIANNCVHATKSLYDSMRNIHAVLQPDGLVMILEMTETFYWCDLVFGLLEGWWLFGDDRQHVVAHQTFWEQKMLAAGFGQVEWTEGQRPEADLQRIIIALASKPEYASLPVPPPIVPGTDLMARQTAIDDYVSMYSEGLDGPVVAKDGAKHLDGCVLVTGGTGSLGAHLVAHLASLPDVKSVVCLNRRSSGRTAHVRQRQEMESKGIAMTDAGWSKLQVFESDTSKPLFGLMDSQYAGLVKSVTHIVHSAWPMSINKPVKGFEPQFRAMRNLIQLAREVAAMRNAKSRITFQFISSIATVGLYPVWSGRTLVPERRMAINSILASGYSDAKFVCERMLDETLHKSGSNFRAMTVRVGQIAGSKTSGYWNRMEHLAFLLKSSQTLNALPQFDGTLSWCPVNDVAATLSDLLLSDLKPYPVYHIENPVRQYWKDMTFLLADCLNIPRSNTVPMNEWVQMVRNCPDDKKAGNPAIQLLHFLEHHHERMNCGGLIMDTRRTRAHSKTLAALGPVSDELVRKYVKAWKDMGFLE